jgi:chromosome segregation ATPase
VAVLKTQVAGQKVKVDKLINERIAVERGAKKKEEELKDRIEAMTDELDFYRSNAGAAGPDPKKVKQLEEEIAKLKAANEGLAKDLEALQAQKSGLDEEVKRVNELEAELERARTAATVATPLIDEEASRALQSEIDTLRAQVAEQQSAIATAASSSAPESDRVLDLTKQLRQLKRDNDMARHLVKTAEDERDEMEAENAELSKRLQSVQTGGSAVDDGELNALRVALKEAEDNATEYREKLDCLELLVKDAQAANTSLQAEIAVRHHLDTLRLAATSSLIN